MEITVLKEQARGCGYRHSGPDGVGLYLMGDGIWEVCERLPFPVGTCPCCGEGVKFSRGFTWITPSKLLAPGIFPSCVKDFNTKHHHELCLFCAPPADRHGLMWIGEKFYTPGSFTEEAMIRGVSKRIASLPHGFKIGEHVIYLAHKKVIPVDPESTESASTGIFTAFRPSRLEIVVDTTDPEALPKRAVSIAEKLGDKARIVKIEPVCSQLNLLDK